MNQKLQEFLERASQEKKKKEQTQREEHLISLGLVDGEERVYSKVRYGKYLLWDKEQKMYYYKRQKPIEVTDEEYELICKYAPYEESSKQKTSNSNTKKYGMMPSGNDAEKFLGVSTAIVCILGALLLVIYCFALLFSMGRYISFGGVLGVLIGVVIGLFGLATFYCSVRVMLNMSNNLHAIKKGVSQIASNSK